MEQDWHIPTYCSRCGKELGWNNKSGHCSKCKRYFQYHKDIDHSRTLARKLYYKNKKNNTGHGAERIKHDVWHGSSLLRFMDNRTAGKIAEKMGSVWLQKLGFENVLHISEEFPEFPFDVLAIYEGCRSAIDITADRTKSHLARRYKLAQWLGFRFFVLHVSFDGIKHQLNEIHEGKKSCCINHSLLASLKGMGLYKHGKFVGSETEIVP